MTNNAAKNTMQADHASLKLSSLVDIDAIKIDKSSLSGDCLVQRKCLDVSLEEAWLLPAGEMCKVAPGQSFSILSNEDGKGYTAKGYTALGEVTLTGPLIWTKIEAPESVGKRLAAADHKMFMDEERIGGMASICITYLLPALLGILIGETSESSIVRMVFLIITIGFGYFIAKFIMKGVESYGRDLLSREGGIFTSEETFSVPEGVKCLSRGAAK